MNGIHNEGKTGAVFLKSLSAAAGSSVREPCREPGCCSTGSNIINNAAEKRTSFSVFLTNFTKGQTLFLCFLARFL